MGRRKNRNKSGSVPHSRRVRAEGVPRAEPDLRRLGRALIDLAMAEAEAAAQAEHAARNCPDLEAIAADAEEAA